MDRGASGDRCGASLLGLAWCQAPTPCDRALGEMTCKPAATALATPLVAFANCRRCSKSSPRQRAHAVMNGYSDRTCEIVCSLAAEKTTGIGRCLWTGERLRTPTGQRAWRAWLGQSPAVACTEVIARSRDFYWVDSESIRAEGSSGRVRVLVRWWANTTPVGQ